MKTTIISIIAVIILIGGTIILSRNNINSDAFTQDFNNVNIVDGKQIIEIHARGGYFPRITTAKADIPTVIKIETNGTFDCSSALVIPSIDYRNNLSPSGETLINISPQKAGTKLQGLCAMGMYNFSIEFN